MTEVQTPEMKGKYTMPPGQYMLVIVGMFEQGEVD